MELQPVLDVSSWSRFSTTHRHPLWWSIIVLVAIEVTVVAAFLISYFYLGLTQGLQEQAEGRIENVVRAWPPVAAAELPILYPTLNTALLLICSGSMFYAGKAMRKEQRFGLTTSFVVCTIAGGAVLYLRWLQLSELPFRWDDHAYGSIVWTLTGFHFVHVTTAVLGTVVIGVYATLGYYGKRRQVPIDADTLYWYFVTFAWVAIYAVMYGFPRLK